MVEISTILWDVGGVLLTNGWDHLERAAVLKKFQLDTDSFEQRHELANDPWEKGLITAEEYLLRTVFYEPRPFTSAGLSPGDEGAVNLAASHRNANPSGACGIRGTRVGHAQQRSPGTERLPH